MRISDVLGMSVTNLWRRKTRTALTVLGVVIGTASIVVMLSLGIGLKESMMAQVSTAGGLTEIFVMYEGEYEAENMMLSDSTIDEFMEIDHVESVQPQLWYSMPVQAGRYESNFNVVGVTDEYLKQIKLEEGKLPESGGMLNMIVGNQVITDFYDSITGEWPYWENEELPNIDMLTTPIIGGIEKDDYYEDYEDSNMNDTSVNSYSDPTYAVTMDDDSDSEYGDDEEKDSDSDSFRDSDEFAFDDEWDGSEDNMSYSMFSPSMKRVQIKVTGVTDASMDIYDEYSYYCYARMDDLKSFLRQNYSENEVIPGQPTTREGKPYRDLKYTQMTIKVDDAENVEEVLEEIQSLGFRGEANKEWLEEMEKEFMIIEAVLGGIGAISMLVAAISIANTMTMSIYERTKEIGVMKVLGCGLGNIRSMFLSEAGFIGFLGGIAGIILSYILSFVVNNFIGSAFAGELDLAEGASISHIPTWLVVLAILFSTIIGMIAGFFPAQRATKLSPLAAIRNE